MVFAMILVGGCADECLIGPLSSVSSAWGMWPRGSMVCPSRRPHT